MEFGSDAGNYAVGAVTGVKNMVGGPLKMGNGLM